MMSDIDDKNDPNYFPRYVGYLELPIQVRRAIENGKVKAKHSDFYYRLSDLNTKIEIYKRFFQTKVPTY